MSLASLPSSNAAGLDRMLGSVRSRIRLIRLAYAFPWAATVGCAACGAAVLAGSSDSRPLMYALIAGAGSMTLILAVWTALHPLSRQRLARRVDGGLGLKDRISTALEVDENASVVAAALHRDAAARAADVEPAVLVPLRWPLAATAMLVTAVAFAVLAPSLASWRGGVGGPVSGGQVTVEAITSLAELAATAAVEREDPHMAAVAGALQELAAESTAHAEKVVTDNERLADLLRALDRLTTPGASVAGRSAVSDRLELASAESLTELLRRLERRLAPLPEGHSNPDEFDIETTWLPGDLARPEPILGEASAVNRPQGAVDAQYASVDNPEAPVMRPDEELTVDMRNGVVIGASEDSSIGASELAGEGSQDLFGAANDVALPGEAEAVAVRGDESEEGRRVATELSPDGRPAEDAGGAFSIGDWRHASLPEIDVSDLPYQYRRVAGAYFLPSQETVNQ